jgi:ABC-type transport system involved in multi-copper enzyme maturation permease subunit
MSAPTPTESHRSIPTPVRRETVVMGRQGFFSVVLRLIGVELYKLRRRTMSRVLITIAVLCVCLVFAISGVSALMVLSTPVSSYTQSGTLSQAQAKQARIDILSGVSESLRLPNSLLATAQIINSVGLLLIIILAGTIVGGEYGVGTIRLMFTRGPTRTQFFAAKLGAILFCIVLSTVVLTFIGILLGGVLNIPTSIGINWSFFTGFWLLHAILYMLTIMLSLCMYAGVAIFLSILGKNTAAGVAGALIWWVLENLLSGLLSLVASFYRGPLGDIIKSLPDYFIINNLDALTQNQHQFLQPGTASTNITDLHALLVLAVYLLLLLGLSWWMLQQRDVTN